MMKNPIAKQVKHLILCLIAIALMAFPASAAGVRGKITSIDSGSISGWAWNPDNTNDVQNVEIHIFQAGKAEPIQYLHVTADILQWTFLKFHLFQFSSPYFTS